MAAPGGQPGAATAGLVFGLGLAVAGWFAIGPDHLVYAVVVQGAFLFMALLTGPALVDVARSRYRVRPFEPRVYTLLGAEALRRLLGLVGWNPLGSHQSSNRPQRKRTGSTQRVQSEQLGAYERDSGSRVSRTALSTIQTLKRNSTTSPSAMT